MRFSLLFLQVLHVMPPPSLFSSYPLLRLPLPGTGPVEFTTGVRDYSFPSHEAHGDLGERPDWVDECTHSYTSLNICCPLSFG